MDKSPVTPGDIVPPRELLGDLILEQGQPKAALAEYRRSLAAAPNRFHSLYGAAKAAEAAGDREAAASWFRRLAALGSAADTARPELAAATLYVAHAQ